MMKHFNLSLLLATLLLAPAFIYAPDSYAAGAAQIKELWKVVREALDEIKVKKGVLGSEGKFKRSEIETYLAKNNDNDFSKQIKSKINDIKDTLPKLDAELNINPDEMDKLIEARLAGLKVDFLFAQDDPNANALKQEIEAFNKIYEMAISNPNKNGRISKKFYAELDTLATKSDSKEFKEAVETFKKNNCLTADCN